MKGPEIIWIGRHLRYKGKRRKEGEGSTTIAFSAKRQSKTDSVLRIFIKGSISMTTEYLLILIAGETKHLKSQEMCSRPTEEIPAKLGTLMLQTFNF